jgi:hypothetical protein
MSNMLLQWIVWDCWNLRALIRQFGVRRRAMSRV